MHMYNKSYRGPCRDFPKIKFCKDYWKGNNSVMEIIKTAGIPSMLSKESLMALYEYGLRVSNPDGYAAEAGVARGGSLYVLANVFDGEIHAFDSWNGFPETDKEKGDTFQKGQFSFSIEPVRELLSFNDKVRFFKGFFDDTFSQVNDDVIYDYVYCDTDLYHSTISCFDFFYPRLHSQGIMLYDDYYCYNTVGVTNAINALIDCGKLQEKEVFRLYSNFIAITKTDRFGRQV